MLRRYSYFRDRKHCLLPSNVFCCPTFTWTRVDSSTNPHCKSFLLYARDILGVNVLFSRANLNQLEKLMTRIGFDLSGSSDYIIKMDTDEYLAVYDEDTSTLKPSLANQYLSQLMKNVSKPEDQRACIRFVQNSVPTKDLCNKDINTAPHLFPFQSAYSLPFYKAIYDSRYIHKYGINLRGHSHRFGDDCVNKGEGQNATKPSVIARPRRCLPPTYFHRKFWYYSRALEVF